MCRAHRPSGGSLVQTKNNSKNQNKDLLVTKMFVAVVTRKGKGFTQEHLALLLGVAQVQVSRWERGLHRPSEKTMSKIREVTR